MRVPGHDFVGHGEGDTKELAQDIAATRFLKYLENSGLVSAAELPGPLTGVDDVTASANTTVSSMCNCVCV